MTKRLTPKGETSRQSIIQSAYQIFLEKGYHAASIRDISQRCGLTIGGVYAHFNGKEDIFIEVLKAYHPFRQVIPAIASARGETSQELVYSMARGMIAALGSQREALNLFFTEVVEFQGRHFALIFPEVFPSLGSAMSGMFQPGANLRPISRPTLIRSFFGYFFSYFMTNVIFRDQLPNDDEALREFTDIYLNGILARDGAPAAQEESQPPQLDYDSPKEIL
jgi:AcrR family transcriptional regulator